ncbi:unnamed protein product [Diamesa serratosioi]
MKLKRRSHIIIFIFCVVSVIFVIKILNSSCFQPSINRYQIIEDHLIKFTSEKVKYIALWTPFFDVKNWGLGNETVGKEWLKSIKCPRTDCVFTNNKDLLDHPHAYDAIVFHGAENWKMLELPKTRRTSQYYIMASMESPGEIKHNLKLDHDFYNLTMTYRLDSDILWNYKSVVEFKTGKIVAPSKTVIWKEPDDKFYDKDLIKLVKSKSKAAAWFVSHCNAFSNRDSFAKKLQDFMEVDIYGKCGTLQCPRGSKHCQEMLNTTYFFYLASENTLCKDYVTEKLYESMNNFIIPIVYSGANLKYFMPPKSYIDANDYATITDLAKHLIYLQSNPQEYIKYFWWKSHYNLVENRAFCQLCVKLHKLNSVEKRQTYVDIKSWWYSGSCQTIPNIKFN